MQTLPACAIYFATRSSHGSICQCRVSAAKHRVLHIAQTCLCVLSECLPGSSCEILFALKQGGPICTPTPLHGPEAETCCCVCTACCSNRRQRLRDNSDKTLQFKSVKRNHIGPTMSMSQYTGTRGRSKQDPVVLADATYGHRVLSVYASAHVTPCLFT